MPPKPSKMLADERRREILKLVRKNGSASVEDLVGHFRVSAVTLRADLGQLAREGTVLRSYGGAILPQEQQGDYPLNVKKTLNHAQKARIAQAAVGFIKSHQTVILDSGTTSGELARAIKRANIEAITVITHALNIAQEFIDTPRISVIMIGGLMRHVSGSFVGPQAEGLLRALHADHFFLGIDGLDPEMRLSTPDLLEAQLNTTMMRISSEVTVIADASKMGRRSLSVISDLASAQRLITDDRISQDLLQKIRQTGIEVVVV